MKIVLNLPMRTREALARVRPIVLYSRDTWNQSVAEAIAEIQRQMLYGVERYEEGITTDPETGEIILGWRIAAIDPAPQLTPFAVQVVARIDVIRSTLSALRQELWFVLSGSLPRWVRDEYEHVDMLQLRYQR